MRQFRLLSLLLLSVCTALPATSNRQAGASATILDDTFADGNSQNQDLTRNSVWLYNGRSVTTRTDAPGSVTFDVTPVAGSSEGFWAYFTNAGSPVTLGVGDKLTV